MHATVVRDEARQLFVSEPDHASDAADACPTDNSAARTARIAESRELAVILANVAGGDQSAFAEFYDRTSSRVYGMVLRVLRDPGFSEEAVQEVYLQAWKSADSFDPAKGVRALLAPDTCPPARSGSRALRTVEFGSTGSLRHHQCHSRIRRRQRRSDTKRRASCCHRLSRNADGHSAPIGDSRLLRRPNVPRGGRRSRRGDSHDQVANSRRTTAPTWMFGGDVRWTKS